MFPFFSCERENGLQTIPSFLKVPVCLYTTLFLSHTEKGHHKPPNRARRRVPGAGAGNLAGHHSAWKWAAKEAKEAKEAGPGIAGAEESGDLPALAGCVLEFPSLYLLGVF